MNFAFNENNGKVLVAIETVLARQPNRELATTETGNWTHTLGQLPAAVTHLRQVLILIHG